MSEHSRGGTRAFGRAGALAVFLLVSAVTVHDFRDVEGEEAQTEMTQFLKNIGLTAGALVFLALSGVA